MTARKLRKYFFDGDDFLNEDFIDRLHTTLYLPCFKDREEIDPSMMTGLTRQNATLMAVTDLIRAALPGQPQGVESVITYNYDNLLEGALCDYPHQSIYQQTHLDRQRLPIYHVHGYVPFEEPTIAYEQDLVFTEDQYHRIARDPYHWSNLVQVQSLTGSATLMVGLSLSDRNMRRILDAIAAAPIATDTYAILQRPKFHNPTTDDLDLIHENAIDYLEKFEHSHGQSRAGVKSARPPMRHGVKGGGAPRAGVKGQPRYQREIAAILDHVQALDGELQEDSLRRLGVTPIWIDDYTEIPLLLSQIAYGR